ncbi:hypothetical protein FIBSPDRAFT_1045847 [Athelia psychrophila]|uniref:Nephrocystin 3-like N-terminal domain-containing protein n=1 Tax=Athelia psychrophila TaxID=1759441 RepID=A0A166HJ22_9AGAM|nr:hypothetical protein FIBSPDRAFT_1045847 [Fibularhizoctonia sp. CBS 109695]
MSGKSKVHVATVVSAVLSLTQLSLTQPFTPSNGQNHPITHISPLIPATSSGMLTASNEDPQKSNTSSNPERLTLETVMGSAVNGALDNAARMRRAPNSLLKSSDVTVDSNDDGDSSISIWDILLPKVKLFADLMDKISEVHPYAKMAWQILSAAYNVFSAQQDRDDKMDSLLKTIVHVYNIVHGYDILQSISTLAPIFVKLMKQTTECAHFITYAMKRSFAARAVSNILSTTDLNIAKYQERFHRLLTALERHAVLGTEVVVLKTEVLVLRILNEIEFFATEVALGDMPYADGARYNDKGGCTPGTHEALLQAIRDWVNEDVTSTVLLVTGDPGIGKSAIANETAKWFEDLERLGSSFCFDPSYPDRKPNKLFSTIARDLADFDQQWKARLYQAVAKKAVRTTSSAVEQFERFILQPSQELATIGPIVVVIDALDQSGTAEARRGVIAALTNHAGNLAGNIRIIITACPEPDIQGLSTLPHVKFIDMNKTDAARKAEAVLAEASDPPPKTSPTRRSRVAVSSALVSPAQRLSLASFRSFYDQYTTSRIMRPLGAPFSSGLHDYLRRASLYDFFLPAAPAEVHLQADSHLRHLSGRHRSAIIARPSATVYTVDAALLTFSAKAFASGGTDCVTKVLVQWESISGDIVTGRNILEMAFCLYYRYCASWSRDRNMRWWHLYASVRIYSTGYIHCDIFLTYWQENKLCASGFCDTTIRMRDGVTPGATPALRSRILGVRDVMSDSPNTLECPVILRALDKAMRRRPATAVHSVVIPRNRFTRIAYEARRSITDTECSSVNKTVVAFKGHQTPRALSFSYGATRVVAIPQGDIIQILDAGTGQRHDFKFEHLLLCFLVALWGALMAELDAKKGISSTPFSRDGTHFALGAGDNIVEVRNPSAKWYKSLRKSNQIPREAWINRIEIDSFRTPGPVRGYSTSITLQPARHESSPSSLRRVNLERNIDCLTLRRPESNPIPREARIYRVGTYSFNPGPSIIAKKS